MTQDRDPIAEYRRERAKIIPSVLERLPDSHSRALSTAVEAGRSGRTAEANRLCSRLVQRAYAELSAGRAGTARLLFIGVAAIPDIADQLRIAAADGALIAGDDTILRDLRRADYQEL